MAWCLPKYLSNQFLDALRKGEITPEKLMSMSSVERNKFFADRFGKEHATDLNRTFEQKLLLKNKEKGIINWAEKNANLKPNIKKDIIDKINKNKDILNPENEDVFLNDLVDYRLGTHVSLDEAKNISRLSSEVVKAKEEMGQSNYELGKKISNKETAYGNARVNFHNYLDELKGKSGMQEVLQKMKSPIGAISEIAGIAKSAKATLDNSALLRQGWTVMLTHPTIWFRNSLKSFSDIVRTIGGKEVMNEVRADIFARKNFDNMMQDKVALNVVEEAYPESIPLEKIPVIGKLHKASETAFTAFQMRNRADLYDFYTQLAKNSGESETVGIGLGKLTNSLTARADLGKYEGAANVVNNIFFAPRKLVANLDVLTAHGAIFGKGWLWDKVPEEAFMRKQAALNLAKVVGGTTAILMTANALMPGSVQWDPRSSDFGQIRLGNTRFDVTGGMRSIPTLVARLISGKSKSSITGKIYELNTGKYGGMTGEDVVVDFFNNKLSPASSVVKDWINGWTNFQGQKQNFGQELSNFLTPLPITNVNELLTTPKAAPLLLGIIADGLGISVNTYTKTPKHKR